MLKLNEVILFRLNREVNRLVQARSKEPHEEDGRRALAGTPTSPREGLDALCSRWLPAQSKRQNKVLRASLTSFLVASTLDLSRARFSWVRSAKVFISRELWNLREYLLGLPRIDRTRAAQ